MRISRGWRWVFLLGLAALVPVFSLPTTAAAAEKPLWELGAGLAAPPTPRLPGLRSKTGFICSPTPTSSTAAISCRSTGNASRDEIFKTDTVLLDVSLYGQVPVKSSDNDARRGMPDLDPTFEVGPSLNITLLENRQDRYKLNLSLPVRAVFSTDFWSIRHEGWVFSPQLSFEKNDFIAGTGLNLGISAGPIFADSGYNSYYYSVDPAYATASRPSYAAGRRIRRVLDYARPEQGV